MKARGRSLLREVHKLASLYHWSEREILALTVERRSAYLALIGEDEDARLVEALVEDG